MQRLSARSIYCYTHQIKSLAASLLFLVSFLRLLYSSFLSQAGHRPTCYGRKFDHFNSPTTAVNAGTARASTPESAAHVNSTTLPYEYKPLLSRRLLLHQSQEMALLGGQRISTAKAAEILSLPASKEG